MGRSQPAPPLVDTRKCEKESRAKAKKCDIRTTADMAQKEIDKYMSRTLEITCTMEQARESEHEAPAMAREHDLHIPKLSYVEIRIKAEAEMNDYMLSARQDASTLFQARQYEKQAQAVARTYNLPIPQLSEAEKRTKAERVVEQHMESAQQWAAREEIAKKGVKNCMEAAQNVARKYNLPIPKLSDPDTRIKVKEKVGFLMMRARQHANTMDRARYYENKAQVLAKEHGVPVPKLSDTDIKLIKQREADHWVVL
jgi:hypothetical protein